MHRQAYLTHSLLTQPMGGAQHMLAPLIIGQVDRTDVGFYRAFDLPHDNLERAVQVRRAVHLLDYTMQNTKHDYP